MEVQFAPSVLSFNHADLLGPVKQLMEAGANWIHCDIMDGQFVPPITFGADMVKEFGSVGGTPMEAHLMTNTPEAHFEAFIKAGCKRIIFHQEATNHSFRLIQDLHHRGVEAGIAINPGTAVETILPVIKEVDLVLVMTVNPGWGGQQFLPSCLDKVRTLRHLREDLHIEVDGGIDPNTIKEARDAGANLFVTGSFLANSETPKKGLAALRAACD